MTKTPTLDVKLENYDGFNCELYDVNSEMLFPDKTNPDVTPLTLIPKLTNIACVIQCGGLWFAGGKFGITWKLFQGVVQPRPSLKGKCLINLTSAAKSTLVKSAEEENADVDNTEESSLVVADDSDVEDEQQSQVNVESNAPVPVSEALAPVPAKVPATPKVVKKVVRTKKE